MDKPVFPRKQVAHRAHVGGMIIVIHEVNDGVGCTYTIAGLDSMRPYTSGSLNGAKAQAAMILQAHGHSCEELSCPDWSLN